MEHTFHEDSCLCMNNEQIINHVKESIPKMIKKLLKENNLTQEKFAQILGVSTATVSNMLNAGKQKKPVALHHLIAISNIFDISLEELCGIEKKKEEITIDVKQEAEIFCRHLIRMIEQGVHIDIYTEKIQHHKTFLEGHNPPEQISELMDRTYDAYMTFVEDIRKVVDSGIADNEELKKISYDYYIKKFTEGICHEKNH